MGFKVICQLEKEFLDGLAIVQEIFSYTISFKLVIDLQQRLKNICAHYLMPLYKNCKTGDRSIVK